MSASYVTNIDIKKIGCQLFGYQIFLVVTVGYA
jgi:hypothetical protein